MTEELKRLSERSIRKLNNEEAFDHIGRLIDISGDAAFARGLERALTLLDELEKRDVAIGQGAVIHYFRANVWSLKAELAGHKRSWAWEQPETQQEILSLSHAVSHEGFEKLHPIRQCQILTNRANLLNGVGRFVDALESWDRALRILPKFAMALGNRARGLGFYARALHDPGHQGLFWLHAHDAAVKAGADDALFDSFYPGLSEQFGAMAVSIAQNVPVDMIRESQNLDGFSLGRSKREKAYRRWCLEERLFLNPLNDLGAHSIAANDVLTLPSLTEIKPPTRPGFAPPIIGFFNQMKQELVSARFMLFEGLIAEGVHFSDKDVLLYNTLDYPSYSLAMERVRTSFRIAYSLLDKIAFLINDYWCLGKRPDQINFRNVWMVEGKKTLLPAFEEYENWPLRGLFWLSKEIHNEALKGATAPDARELHDLRNHLEHKYLQVHEGWAVAGFVDAFATGELGKSLSSHEMEAKALRVMKIARSALCYLSLAIGREEELRDSKRPDGPVFSMPLATWDDAWKRSR
ncbi:MAG: LA2681 family HEPN domain-containing protein [Magnetospirillum sp.]|nr:LA2681 family HEPN domain-containing protein [Magnetospirillum sp.]